jgi:hypothetical protein
MGVIMHRHKNYTDTFNNASDFTPVGPTATGATGSQVDIGPEPLGPTATGATNPTNVPKKPTPVSPVRLDDTVASEVKATTKEA